MWSLVLSRSNIKLIIAEMKILRWMCDSTLQERIISENVFGLLGIAPIEAKMKGDTCLPRPTDVVGLGITQRRGVDQN